MPPRRSITIATAGHVDHGKSALVKRITGTDTDTLADEKSRGMSINLGFAYRHLPSPATLDSQDRQDLSIGFIDVPGHRDFINNALAGISVVDAALLVIAADDGIMPQTTEHLAILDLLGIRHSTIVITKADKVSSDDLARLSQTISALVSGTCLASAPVFPVSSLTGQGMEALLTHLDAQLQSATLDPDQSTGQLRYIIDRSFVIKGIGTVVTGTVKSGSLHVNDSFIHSASGTEVRIRGISHDGRLIDRAEGGERVALNINLSHQQVSRGDWLVHPHVFLPVSRFDVKLRLLPQHTIRPGVAYHFYHGASHTLARVRPLAADGASPYYQVVTREPVVALYGDRFILLDAAADTTIGGGSVVDVRVPRRGRSLPRRLSELAARDRAHLPALQQLLADSPEGVNLTRFAAERNLDDAAMNTVLTQLDAVASTVILNNSETAGSIRLSADHYQAMQRRVWDTLKQFHQAHADQQGMDVRTLIARAELKLPAALCQTILRKMLADGDIKLTGASFHLPYHRIAINEDDRIFDERVRPLLIKAGRLAPRTLELAEMTGMHPERLEKILTRARRSDRLHRVAANRHYLPETLDQLITIAESLAQREDGGFSVIEFRDASGLGRNLCIEILEYLDRSGLTRRDDNRRFLTGSSRRFASSG